MRPPKDLTALVVVAAAASFIGLSWGLPHPDRADLVLGPDQRTDSFYAGLAKARNELYAGFDGLLMGHFAKTYKEGFEEKASDFSIPAARLSHSFSSFLVRSTDPDEQLTLTALSQMKPGEWDFNPRYFAYGGAFIYAVGGILTAGKVLGVVHLVPDITHYYANPFDSAKLYLAARLLSAVVGVLVAVWLFRLGERLTGSRGWGWVAGALGAFSPALLSQAHLGKPHAVGGFFALLALERCLDIVDEEGKSGFRPYLFAGAYGGAATGVMMGFYPLGILLVATAHLLVRPLGWRPFVEAKPWAAAGAMAAVFFAMNPYILLDFSGWYTEIAGFQLQTRKFDANPFLAIPYVHFAVRRGLGTLLCYAGVLSCLAFLFVGGKREKVVAIPALAFLVYMAMQLGRDYVIISEFVRYYHAGVAFLVLGAVVGLRRLGESFPERKPVVRVAAALLLATTSFHGIRYGLNFRLDRPGSSNGHAAGTWINENLEEGSRLGILGPMPHLYNEPPFRFSRFSFVDLSRMRFNGEPARGAMPKYVILGQNFSARKRSRSKENHVFLRENGYVLLKEFRRQGLFRGFKNYMTTANLPFQIWELRGA